VKHEANIRSGGKTVHVVFSVNIYPEVYWKKRGGRRSIAPPPPPKKNPITILIPSWSVDISLQDDVTVIVFLCVPDFFDEDGDRRASLSGGTKEKDDLPFVSYSPWPCSPEFIYQRRYIRRILAMDLPPEHVFIKKICAKRLGLKLILFVGISYTSFLAYFSVYLTLLKVVFTTTPTCSKIFLLIWYMMLGGAIGRRKEVVSNKMEIIKCRKNISKPEKCVRVRKIFALTHVQ
jgi:hypothetical protein